MKRVFIISALMLFCFVPASFAVFGLEAGLNYNSVTMSSDYMNIEESGSGTAFHFGGYYNYPLKGKSEYLKLALGMTTRKVKVEASEGGATYTMEPDMKSFDIAVLYMKPAANNPKLTYIAGMTVVKETDGNVKYSYSEPGYSESTTDSVDDDDLETDFFITGGLKYQMSNNIYPEVKLQYNLSPSRDFWDSDVEFSNYFTILFSVAMEFE